MEETTSAKEPPLLMSENILQRLQESQERFLEKGHFEQKHSPDLTSLSLLPVVLQYVHDGILFVNLAGKITLMNDSAQKILSRSMKEQTPSFWDLFPDEYFGFSMKEALNFGMSHKLIYRTYPTKELEITTTFQSLGPKSSHGLLVFFQDITEKQRLQTIIHRDERVKKLGEMVATTTHEIRNPLGGIRGYASLLYRDLSQQKHLQDMAGYIMDATKGLERLVSRILQYARPLQLQTQSIEIGGFIKQFVKFMKEDPARPKCVSWELHIPDDPVIAPIDCEILKSALINLVLNGWQAMPLGGTLTISLLKTDSCYQIAISDTGIGMDEEQLKQIFSPLFTTKEKGNGLGLVEVQKNRSSPLRDNPSTLVSL